MKKHRPRIRKPKNRGQRKPVATPQGLFHGGAPYLKLGDYILPRAVTGSSSFRTDASTTGWLSDVVDAKAELEDDAWVYLTDCFALAAYYATYHKSGCGMIYRVEPDGTFELDPDRPVDSYRASRAKIVARETVPFRLAQQLKSVLGKCDLSNQWKTTLSVQAVISAWQATQ